MLTVADLVNHIGVQVGQCLVTTALQKARLAVSNGWSRMMDMFRWRYYYRHAYLQMDVAQTTGSIQFVESTRLVTLTGATWPTDVTSKHIRFDNAWYPIKTRTSSTVIELYPEKHPAQDIAAGTSYSLQKVLYPLPFEVGEIVQLINPAHTMALHHGSLIDVHVMSDTFGQTAQPTTFTLVADDRHPGRWCLWCPAIIVNATTLNYLYIARRNEKLVVSETRGTVTISGGIATFSDAVVNDNFIGAVLRVSKNSLPPSSKYGRMDHDINDLNMDCNEVIIETVTSTTQCTVRDASLSASAKLYEVSSLIDVKEGSSMEVLLQRLVEDEWGVRPVANHMEGLTSQRKIREALQEAMSADQIAFSGAHPLLPIWYNLRLSDIAGSVR